MVATNRIWWLEIKERRMLMSSENVVLNVTGESIKKNHISWTVSYEPEDRIVLYEIVERFYPHPQALEHSIIGRIEQDRIVAYRIDEIKSAPLLLLKHAVDNISLIMNYIQLEKEKK